MQVTTNYPLLRNETPPLPERSSYYHLEPVGAGTAFVESLTSYISRLAAAHCVSIATLYEYTIVPSLKKHYLSAPEHSGSGVTLLGVFKKQIKTINGVGKVAREWSDLFENLTHCQDLTRLTFLPWSEVLTYSKLTRNNQAWCSVCYEEMRDTGGIIYQPLIWTVEVLQICPRHRVYLVDQCPQCNHQFPNLTRRLRLGFCPSCNYWLGRKAELCSAGRLQTNTWLEWQEFVGDNICELILVTQAEAHKSSKNNIAKWIQTFADRITDGKTQPLSALLGRPYLTVYEWRCGRIRPMLFELLRICYCLGLRLVDLLTGSGLKENFSFNFRQFPVELEPIRKTRTPRPFDCSRVRRQVERYLDVTPPVSMAKVAAELGYDRGLLYKYLPDLHRKICDRHKEFLQAECKKRRIQLQEEVREVCLELYRKGVYLTERSVAEFLGKPTYKGRRNVRAMILETRRQLGQSRK